MIMTLRPPKFFECASRDDSFVVSFGAVSLNDLPHVISQLNAISASESQIHKTYRRFLPSEIKKISELKPGFTIYTYTFSRLHAFPTKS